MASRLADVRDLLEKLIGEIALARYRADAGYEGAGSLRDVIEKHSALLDPALLDMLAEEAARAEGEEGERIAELRRAVLFLHLNESSLEPTERLWKRIAETKVRGEGEEVPFPESARRIAEERDRRKRSILARARERAIAGWESLLLDRISRLDAKASELGFGGYGDLLRRETGIDLAALDGLAGEFLARTHEMYREVLSWLLKKRLDVDPSESEHCDLMRIFRGEEYDSLFPAEKVIPVLASSARSLQIDLQAEGRIEIDLEDRPGKRLLPFCAPVKVPERVILCAPPAGGHAHYRSLFHALGHCLHHANASADLDLEWRCLGDDSVTEAFAFLAERLVQDPRWLKRYLKVERPGPYVTFTGAYKLYSLRRTAARYRYELQLYSGRPSPRSADAYRVGLSEACLSMFPRALYLFDLSSHLYSARRLRGWILEALLHRHLVHYFEEDWFRNPRAGTFLVRLWRKGQEGDAERIASQIGYPALDPQPLIEDLERRF